MATQRAEFQRKRPEFGEHRLVSVAGEALRGVDLRLRVRIAGKPDRSAEQTAEQSDVVLEYGHVRVGAEREVVDRPRGRLVELGAQSQQPERVQRVHQRHPHAAPVVVPAAGRRLQLVVPERPRGIPE